MVRARRDRLECVRGIVDRARRAGRRGAVVVVVVLALPVCSALPAAAQTSAVAREEAQELRRADLRERERQSRLLASIEQELQRLADESSAPPDALEWTSAIGAILAIVAAAGATYYAGRSVRLAQSALGPQTASADAAREQATTALAQFQASTRPLLIEVRPYAPPTPDLGGILDDSARPIYHLRYPGDAASTRWDARRAHVYWHPGEPIKVSLILRNVGQGLAKLRNHVGVRVDGVAATVLKSEIRYPRLPPDATTRVNAVLDLRAPEVMGSIEVCVSYGSMSGTIDEVAVVTVAPRRSRAWTASADGIGWIVTDVAYITADDSQSNRSG